MGVLDGFGCEFALLFVQTEMSPCTTLFRPEHQLSHIGAVGTPLIGVQVAIMGPDGELLPPGETGEIVYRGPSTMSGYLDNEEATGAAFADEVYNPNFETLAAAFGVRYECVDGPESLQSVLKRVCAEAGPTLIEAPVGPMPNPWSLIRLSPPPPGFTAPPNPLGDVARAG